jgi:hypothetical protein
MTITNKTWEERQAFLKELYEEAIENKIMYPEDPQVYYKHKCWHCGRVFYAQSNRARFCSYRCTNDGHTKRQNAREKARREEIRRNRVCEYCNNKFVAKRAHSKYCSDSHRVLACLARKKKKQEEEKISPA